MKSLRITKAIVAKCKAARACAQGYRWIARKPRTLAELYAHSSNWATWLATQVDLPQSHAMELYWLTGCRSFWRNGRIHRDAGPAVEYSNGFRAWYRNGQLHRDAGPAFEHPSGYRAWYRNGEQVAPPPVVPEVR